MVNTMNSWWLYLSTSKPPISVCVLVCLYFSRIFIRCTFCRGCLWNSLSIWCSLCWSFVITSHFFNSQPPGPTGRRFADDIFKCIFMNENVCIWIDFHWRPALVQIMAYRRSGDKPLSEPMLIHPICKQELLASLPTCNVHTGCDQDCTGVMYDCGVVATRSLFLYKAAILPV